MTTCVTKIAFETIKPANREKKNTNQKEMRTEIRKREETFSSGQLFTKKKNKEKNK